MCVHVCMHMYSVYINRDVHTLTHTCMSILGSCGVQDHCGVQVYSLCACVCMCACIYAVYI